MPAVTVPVRGHRELRSHRVSLPGHVYHITTATLGRSAHFREFTVARSAIRAFCNPAVLRDSTLIAWVLMPDHAHWLVQLGDQDELGALAIRLKASSSRAANRCLRRTGPLWQHAYHDHLLRREEDVRAVARYIVMNPLRAGIAARVSGYSHWDAMWV